MKNQKETKKQKDYYVTATIDVVVYVTATDKDKAEELAEKIISEISFFEAEYDGHEITGIELHDD